MVTDVAVVTAVAWGQSLAWKLPHAVGAAKKKKRNYVVKNKKRKKKNLCGTWVSEKPLRGETAHQPQSARNTFLSKLMCSGASFL